MMGGSQRVVVQHVQLNPADTRSNDAGVSLLNERGAGFFQDPVVVHVGWREVLTCRRHRPVDWPFWW